jgi:hypothetical protein
LANQERRWLVAGIREVLLPAFHACGFKSVALTEEESRGELRTAFPFGRLRRASESGLDVVEIQLARHGEAAFRISAGVVPLEGITHTVVGRVAAADVWSSHLPRHYVLYDVPLLGRWFSLWHWPGRRVAQADVMRLVNRVAKIMIPEIEAALREGQCGKHVKQMGA